MKLTILGAAHEVTGSCSLLEAAGHRILIYCGMEQGADIYENVDLPILPGEIDCVVLTHAHIDHAGKIPALVAKGYSGPICTSEATRQLCGIMLMDSAHIQESDAEWKNRKRRRAGLPEEPPAYTAADVQKTLSQFLGMNYGEEREILPGVTLRLSDAGHLLGSASAKFTVTEGGETRSVLFSGDLGNHARPLIRDPQRVDGADYVIIESTYGDRTHGPRADYVSQLTRVIQETLDRGGNLISPAFAVGRTQEFLYLIREIKERGLISGHDGFPVFVDSPLAVEATRIYDGGLMDFYDEDTLAVLARGGTPLKFPGLQLSVTSDDSKAINLDKRPKVIISSSGMCEAGRIRHHLKYNLWRPESAVLFVGYQAEGTLGRALQDGADSVKILGDEVAVRAHIESMDGISGHADRDMMLDWLRAFEVKPAKVFVNHGEDTVCDAFAADITKELGFAAEAPYSGAVYDLTANTCLAPGSRVRIVKKAKTSERGDSPAYLRLLSAGRRLLSVIEANRGGANKDLARFASQIQSLCDKWKK